MHDAHPLSRFGKVFRCIRRFGVSHGSHVEPGRTPKRLMELDAMNYPNLLSRPTTPLAGRPTHDRSLRTRS